MICKKCNKRHTNCKKGVCVACQIKSEPEKWDIIDLTAQNKSVVRF